MNASLTETEIKLYAPDLNTIRARLETAGAVLRSGRTHEHNVWYENAEETLRSQQIVLRLRRDQRVRLTFKAPAEVAEQGRVRTRFEAEVEVNDFDTMDIILQRLGFHPSVIYEKFRTTYTLNTSGGEVEIVLDEMPFGSFVEVEGAPAAIEAALAALGLEHAPRILTNYMTLFEHVKSALGLHMHDLTFANFAGVHVPPTVFGSGPFISEG